MSSTSLPIGLTQFTAALPSLPISSLHLRAAELRNSIAHLDYSNEQLAPHTSDPICSEAITENEVVIKRMSDRLAALKREVEARGGRWIEALTAEEVARALAEGQDDGLDTPPVVTGTRGDEAGAGNRRENGSGTSAGNPWTDGTFSTGRINGEGEVIMNPPQSTSTRDASSTSDRGPVNGVHDVTSGNASQPHARNGGIGDEEMRARLEERMRQDMMADEDDGMHL